MLNRRKRGGKGLSGLLYEDLRAAEESPAHAWSPWGQLVERSGADGRVGLQPAIGGL